jgi:hypothetical protein
MKAGCGDMAGRRTLNKSVFRRVFLIFCSDVQMPFPGACIRPMVTLPEIQNTKYIYQKQLTDFDVEKP